MHPKRNNDTIVWRQAKRLTTMLSLPGPSIKNKITRIFISRDLHLFGLPVLLSWKELDHSYMICKHFKHDSKCDNKNTQTLNENDHKLTEGSKSINELSRTTNYLQQIVK